LANATSAKEGIAAMQRYLPRLTAINVLEGCGHWIQQERAADVNQALLEFLNGLG
jgi:pimeloyl-ACP methyl ester carboxylesterase